MSIDSKHKRTFLNIVLSGPVLVIAAIWLAGSSKAEQTEPALSRPALTVRTTTLREDRWARTLTASGSILPWQEVQRD